jgi:putative membrane protein
MKNVGKKPSALHSILRVLVIWGISAVALIIMTFLLDGIQIESIGVAIVGAAVIGLLNALLWPLLSFILVPFAVFTLGFAALLMNGLVVWFSAQLMDSLIIDGYWTAFWVALGMSAINIILSSLLTIDDDHSWYRNQVKRRIKRTAKPEVTDEPGVLFLEIDGLARPILEKALEEGHMPTLQRWLESGSHTVSSWETDTSSQTSASQAGILHGDNSNIPAFRWYDKESSEIVASSNPSLLPGIEQSHSDGNGLLSDDGASRGNLFSGDAVYVMATASAIKDKTKFHTSEFQAYFTNPYNFSRTLLLFLWDVILEWRQFRAARKNNVKPILDKSHRGGIYPLIRAAMTILMRELNIYTLIGDVFAGRKSAYATFVGYDEIAHHSGILDPGAFDTLFKLDQQFARLETAIRDAPRPYHLVILSDHGQTGGATFKQRYDMSLEEFVQQLMHEGVEVGSYETAGEAYGHLSVVMADTIHNETSGASKVMGRALKDQTVDGQVHIGPEAEQALERAQKEDEEEKPHVIALASGNLGLIAFTEWDHRMTLEEIEEAFPDVIPGLRAHEGIGFIMIRSEKDGPVVMGANGAYYLADDRVEGENPLTPFGSNAPAHLRRTDGFPNCPDILVNSFYDPENNEGAAFEELIGFHGGLGGTQTQPFLMHPSELSVDGELIGAVSVYQVCKGWLNLLQNGGGTGSKEVQIEG